MNIKILHGYISTITWWLEAECSHVSTDKRKLLIKKNTQTFYLFFILVNLIDEPNEYSIKRKKIREILTKYS